MCPLFGVSAKRGFTVSSIFGREGKGYFISEKVTLKERVKFNINFDRRNRVQILT